MTADPDAPVCTQEVIRALTGWRCDLLNEKTTQGDIAAALQAAGIPFVREQRIGGGEIIDFVVDNGARVNGAGGIGIEVKIKGSKRALYRQIVRYCDLGVLDALIVATSVPIGLPDLINGTPVFVRDLTRAWL